MELQPKYRLWLETEDGYVLGKGSFELLQGIPEKGTLRGAAKSLGMSYRHAWGIIKQIEKHIGKSLLDTYRGGKSGGGAKLTRIGYELLETYSNLIKAFDSICVNWKEK